MLHQTKTDLWEIELVIMIPKPDKQSNGVTYPISDKKSIPYMNFSHALESADNDESYR